MPKSRSSWHLVLSTIVGALTLIAIAIPATDAAAQPVELAPGSSRIGTEELSAVHGVGEDTVVYLDPGAPSRPMVEGSLVLPPSPDAPEGAFGEVVSVRRVDGGGTAVKVAPEPLDQAYSRYNLNLHGETVEELEAEAKQEGILESPAMPQTVELSFINGLKEFLDCDASAEAEGSITAGFGKLEPVLRIHLHPNEFSFELRGEPRIIAKLTAHGSGDCAPRNLPEIVIPLPAHGVPLALTIGPAARAKVDGDFESTFSWGPNFVVGGRMIGRKTVQAIHTIEFEKPAPPTAEGSGKAILELGLKVGLTLAGRVGISGTAGPVVEAALDLSGTSVCTTGTAAGFLEFNGEADIFIRHWKMRIGRTEFGKGELWSKGDCEADA